MNQIITNDFLETRELGKKIAQALRGGEVFLLVGDLGAGKTTLVQGVAEYLKIKKNITSPTFVLMKIYQVKEFFTKTKKNKIKNLVHIDTYRGLDLEDLENIGALEYLGRKDSVCFVEWGAGLEKYLKRKKVEVVLIKIKNIAENIREININ